MKKREREQYDRINQKFEIIVSLQSRIATTLLQIIYFTYFLDTFDDFFSLFLFLNVYISLLNLDLDYKEWCFYKY